MGHPSVPSEQAPHAADAEEWVFVNDAQEEDHTASTTAPDSTNDRQRSPQETESAIQRDDGCEQAGVRDIEDAGKGNSDAEKCAQCNECQAHSRASKSPSTSGGTDPSHASAHKWACATFGSGADRIPPKPAHSNVTIDPITHLLRLTDILNHDNRLITQQVKFERERRS